MIHPEDGDAAAKHRAADALAPVTAEARVLASKLGLDPAPVHYWIVDHDEVNRAVAYDGFQTRYPHWRWGMKYDRIRKQDRFTPSRIYELVVNDEPCHAYLQLSNDVADQKAVVTHVEAHADFFANNRWFERYTGGTEAAAMLARHAETIGEYMEDPDIGREAVERWIDHALCLEDNVDQHDPGRGDGRAEAATGDEAVDGLGVSEEVEREVFGDDWADRAETDRSDRDPPEPDEDLLGFLAERGMQYDEESGRAVAMEDWQRDVLRIIRREAYYFVPQKMTKVMNEGWSAYWESVMMAEEGFADDDEFLSFADHQSRVLAGDGLNPYSLGKQLWEYVENDANREELLGRLLAVDGVTPGTFHDAVDLDAVEEALRPPEPLVDVAGADLDRLASLGDDLVDHEGIAAARDGDVDPEAAPWRLLSEDGLARRHYSLLKPQNRSFLREVSTERLEERRRYLMETERYATVTEAIDDLDYGAGWHRMREVRATHNDVTFIDAFLTQEFVDRTGYFAYEHSHATERFHVSSTDHEDVKRKLLLEFTNLGKPRIAVHDANHDNAGELLLAHHYNGVALDVAQAKRVLERIHELWGRPVNLKTIQKGFDDNVMKMARRRGREPEPKERGVLFRYDGESFERRELDDEEIEGIAADAVDYDTKPEDWLA